MVTEKTKVKRKQWTKSLKVVVLTGIMLAMSGCYFLPKAEETLAPPLKEPMAVTYDTVDVKKDSLIQQITGRGSFESVSRSNIYFSLRGGYLKKIYVKDGDHVKKGDLLVELDTDSLKMQVKQQQAQVDLNEAIYNQMKSTGKLDIEAAKKQMDDIKKEYDDALSVPEAYSVKELEGMENGIEQQEIALKRLELSYGVDKHGKEGYALKQASATLEISKESLSEMQGELDKSLCVSPIDGVIVYTADVNIGDYIKTFQTLVRISDPKEVYLIYEEKDEDKSSQFKTGMKVSVTKESSAFDDEDKTYEGEVLSTPKDLLSEFGDGRITSTEIKNRQYDIVIRVKDFHGTAEMGDYYSVELVLQKRENAIVVPNRVITVNGERKYVSVLINGVRYERDVEIGIVAGTQTEIIKGLQVGEKVVIR